MKKTRRWKIKDKSTLTKSEFVVDHVLFGLLIGPAFMKVILPNLVPITYFQQSYIKLIVCLLVASLVGIAVSFVNYRTGKGVIIDVLAGLGIYTGLILKKYVDGFLRNTLIGTAVITFIAIAFILCRKIKKQSNRHHVIFIRFIRSMQLMRRNFGIASVVILVFIPVLLHFDSNKQLEADYTSRIETNSNDHDEISEDWKDTLEVYEGYDDRYRLSENIDKIKLIRDNKTFQKLSYEEKKDVVTAILHCEGRYLGLEEFDIVFSDDLDIMTLGTCNFENRTITINARHLRYDTANSVLSTCLHECRHYYQHLMIDLYVKASPEQRNLYAFTSEEVASWYENVINYHSVNDSNDTEEYESYAMQSLEVDARQWANEQVQAYYDAIDEMTKETAN